MYIGAPNEDALAALLVVVEIAVLGAGNFHTKHACINTHLPTQTLLLETSRVCVRNMLTIYHNRRSPRLSAQSCART